MSQVHHNRFVIPLKCHDESAVLIPECFVRGTGAAAFAVDAAQMVSQWLQPTRTSSLHTSSMSLNRAQKQFLKSSIWSDKHQTHSASNSTCLYRCTN